MNDRQSFIFKIVHFLYGFVNRFSSHSLKWLDDGQQDDNRSGDFRDNSKKSKEVDAVHCCIVRQLCHKSFANKMIGYQSSNKR